MKHCLCHLSDLQISINEVYQTMGYGDNQPDEYLKFETGRILDELNSICKPQYIYAIYPGMVKDNVSIQIGDNRLKLGKTIVSYLSEVEYFCVFVTTAGQEYDSYKKKLRADGELLKEFIADSIGSVIAEACVSRISEELSAKQNIEHTYPYSPGYCGWKLKEQQILFGMLPNKPCGVELTESCLMMPIKSISGIFGLGRNIQRKAYGCTICENINCYKRKT